VLVQTTATGSPFAVARNLFAAEGVRGFARGFAPPLIATGPRNAIGFAVQGEASRRCSEWLTSRTRSPPDPETVRLASAGAGGVCAGLAQCAVIVPADRIKVQQQVLSRASGRAPEPVLEVAARLVRTHGVVGGLAAGGTATAMRQAPSAAMYFGFYHALHPRLRERLGSGGPAAPMLAGGVAGVLAYALTYPLDVIKARQQASGGAAISGAASSGTGAAAGRSSGGPGAAVPTVLQTVRALHHEMGSAWMVRGIGPTLLRAFVVNAVNFAVFERLKEAVEQQRRYESRGERERR